MLHWRNDFDKLLLLNLNDDVVFISNSVVFVLKTIINVVWNTKIFFIFSLIQVVFAKFFENFRTRFSLTMLISFIRKFIFLEINTFKNAFSISKSSFDNFDEWEQRKLFFRKEKLFSLFNDLFFRKKKIISLFFIETFCFDISIVTKMLIVNFDLNSNDDVSSNINNWDFFDDEIFFFIIDFEITFSLKLFRTNFRIEILSYLLFIAVFNYLHENRTIRYIKFFFFFFKKIDFLVRIEKFRFIEDNVAIIIYVVFLWISNSKNIDEVIFYQIFDEYSRFHFLTFFECIYFF
jgi:hypothetical protein